MLAAIRKNSQHFTRNIIMANPSRRKKIGICRKIALTLFLHLIAFAAVIAYCAIGAQIFMSIENQHEMDHCINVNALRVENLDKMFKKAIALQKTPNDFLEEANSLMEEYEYTLLKKKARGTRSGDFYDDCVEFNFPGSFFYSLSVVTTIGNGEVIPDTHEGRLVSILYALLGIPLFILYLGFTGSSLARSLQGIFLRACGCCQKDDGRRELAMSRLKKRSDVDGVETLKVSDDPEDSSTAAAAGVSFTNVPDDYDADHAIEPPVLSDIDVEHRPYWCPILVAMLLLAAHAIAGTLFIASWEEWSVFDSFYLIFLFLSTIGFGDILEVGHPVKEGAFVPIYFLTGYTIWAAVYILVYEVVQQKFRNIGKRLGIK